MPVAGTGSSAQKLPALGNRIPHRGRTDRKEDTRAPPCPARALRGGVRWVRWVRWVLSTLSHLGMLTGKEGARGAAGPQGGPFRFVRGTVPLGSAFSVRGAVLQASPSELPAAQPRSSGPLVLRGPTFL